MSRARGPHSPKQTRAAGHVAQRHRAVVRQVLAQPRRVVVAERRAGDEQVARRPRAASPSGPPRSRRGGSGAGCRRSSRPRRSMSFAHIRPRNAVAPGPTTSSLANDVSSNRPAARRVASASAPIAGDQCIPAQPRGRSASSPAAALDSNQFGRSQPDFSPKAAPRSREDLVGRRRPQRSPGLALLVRVVDVVVGRVVLDRPRERVAPGCDRPARTGGCPSSTGRAPARRRRSSDAIWRPIPPAPGDAVRREARPPRRSRGPRDSPRMNSLSGVNASGPLMTRLTPASAIAGTRRMAPSMIGSKRGHVGREELAVEVGRDAVERPRRRVALVAAHAQAADLLAEVDEVVGVAQLRQAGVDALDRLGEEVLVGHRDDRHGDADHPADLRREHAAGVDDDVGARSRVRSPLCSTVTPVTRPRSVPIATTRVCGRICAPRWRAPGGERVGEARRVEPAVGRQPDGAEDAVGRHQREAVLGLLGA